MAHIMHEVWCGMLITYMYALLCVAPSFVVRLYKTKIYTSKIYENIRKTDMFAELSLPQPLPLCGDIKIEFFHNARITGKVRSCTIL